MSPNSTMNDCLIVGGSHAGLSVALTLYRALHTCVIFDSHASRNTYDTPIHLTSTCENHSPEEMREASCKEIANSGLITFQDAIIEKIEKLGPKTFRVTDSKGHSWQGRSVVLAIGVKDVFPDIEGYRENFSKAIFPCMFQFGYEQKGVDNGGLLAIQSLAHASHAIKLAYDGHKFARQMTIYTNSNPKLASDIVEALETSEIFVDDRKIRRLIETQDSTIKVEFESGGFKTEAFLVHRPQTILDRNLSDQLLLEYGPTGDIKVQLPFCETTVPGVYAVGDCASPMKIIPNAMAMGAYAGAGVARDLPRHVTGNPYQ